MEEQGVPAIAIVTTPFRNTGEAMARSWGLPDYAFLDTPHPIANLIAADLATRIERHGERELLLREERCDDGRVGVHRDGEHEEAALAPVAPQPLELGHLALAGLAPRRPEVDEHYRPAVLDQAKGLAVRQ